MVTEGRRPGSMLSLLDRLTDLQPESKTEPPMSSWEEMREFKASLCRDLEAILNTRRAEEDFDPAYEEATNSLLTFGVADFTAYNVQNSIEQERVRLSIERAIRKFEPRLARVTVTMAEPDPLRPLLRFEIAALLQVNAAAEPVLFEVALHRDLRRMAVSGADL